MSRTIPCDLCGADECDMIISNVHDGDTIGVCFTCLPKFAEVIVRQMDISTSDPLPDGEPPDDDSDDDFHTAAQVATRAVGDVENGRVPDDAVGTAVTPAAPRAARKRTAATPRKAKQPAAQTTTPSDE